MITPAAPTEMNATTYTAIKVPAADAPPGLPTPMLFLPEDEASWYYATTAAGANEVKLAEGRGLSLYVVPDADGTVLYAKGTTTVNLGVHIGLRG